MVIGIHLFRRTLLVAAHALSSVLPPTSASSVKRVAFVLGGIDLGAGVKVVSGVRFHYSNVQIGPNSWIGTECHFFATPLARISIGARVDVAPGCYFVVGSHQIGGPERRAGLGDSKPITIGDGTWIGARSVILGGTTVGSGCIVAAGAVVRGVFPDNVLIGGVPARVIKKL